jgi:formate hydrogenlyase subunit 3/multisubunit Na+/H+ antiporter MnhD subunit
VIAHISVAILLCFGVLQGGSGDYTLAACVGRAAGRVAELARSSSRPGFGAKAGLRPVWLPEAHPAAIARLR